MHDPIATARAALLALPLLAACPGGAPAGSPSADLAVSVRPLDASVGVTDASAFAIDATVPAPPPDLSVDATTPINPVSFCPVQPMDQLYPGTFPPNPYGTLTAATQCVSAMHDVIIVLGCPNNADGTPSTCQTKRADLAVAFMNAGYGTQFITSGAAVQNAFVEADTLKQLLVARGVPAASILTDTRAQHTDENIYYSTRIMEAYGWTDAIVISEDPGQLVYEATCDSNCCVALGRLTVLDFSIGCMTVAEAHYVRYPWAASVPTAECSFIENPLKAMCLKLSSRRACASNFQLPDGVDAGM
jgi:hypothetical protein